MTYRWIDLSEFPDPSLTITDVVKGAGGTVSVAGTTLSISNAEQDGSGFFRVDVQAADSSGLLTSLETNDRRVTVLGLTATNEEATSLTVVCGDGYAEYYGSLTGANRNLNPVFQESGVVDTYDTNDIWVYYNGSGFTAPHTDGVGMYLTSAGAVSAVLTYQVYADDAIFLSNDEYTSGTGIFSDAVEVGIIGVSPSADGMTTGDAAGNHIGASVEDVAVASCSVTSSARLLGAVFDGAVFGGLAESSALMVNAVIDELLTTEALSAQRVYSADLVDSASLGDQIAAQRQYIADLVDAIALSELAGSRLQASAVVASAIAAADALSFGFTDSMTDSAVFNEVLSARLAVTTVAVDSAVFADLPASQLVLTFQLADSVQVGEQATARAALISRLADSAVFSVALNLSGETIYGYVCNAETRGFTTYANYPFNSFAKIGNDYYGMADDGLYLLTGDDDGGEPIEARIRTALTTLGTAKQKRMPSVYFGLASNGRMVLKAITTSSDGEKREDWYLLEERNAGATRETRTKLGRGLKSVYWGFELVNVDGASFDLDTLQLFPMILERRL